MLATKKVSALNSFLLNRTDELELATGRAHNLEKVMDARGLGKKKRKGNVRTSTQRGFGEAHETYLLHSSVLHFYTVYKYATHVSEYSKLGHDAPKLSDTSTSGKDTFGKKETACRAC